MAWKMTGTYCNNSKIRERGESLKFSVSQILFLMIFT